MRRKPYARVRAVEEPTGQLKASDLGRLDEAKAEEIPDPPPKAVPAAPRPAEPRTRHCGQSPPDLSRGRSPDSKPFRLEQLRRWILTAVNSLQR